MKRKCAQDYYGQVGVLSGHYMQAGVLSGQLRASDINSC